MTATLNVGYDCYVILAEIKKSFQDLFQETIKVERSENLGLYLGLPLSHKRPKKRDVQFVIEKVRKRLASWKTNYLSRAGRLTLISSTLNTIPSYYMQATCFPVASLVELDRICNNFLWGETEGKNHMHLVSKEATFLLPKNLGGLGIRNHRTLNQSLMAKLGWKMCQGPPNLAQDCILSKYVKNTGITKFKNGSHIWQSIGKGWHILESSCQWKLGNGLMVSFWEDDWLGLGPLRSCVIGPLSEKRIRSECQGSVEYGGLGWYLLHV